jgi:xanthine dehydrogenase YagS FAD-binding subunit
MAIALRSRHLHARFLGGGTNLIDLMRGNVEQPHALVDVTGLPLQEIRELADGAVFIGAAVKNTAMANHRLIRERYPVLSQAILCGASGQIRNMATVAGNMMQRTRCCYFYDAAANCNKRLPGSGCDAIDGFSRTHAILGASTLHRHPPVGHVRGSRRSMPRSTSRAPGTRAIPFGGFHRLPGDTPHLETALQPDD